MGRSASLQCKRHLVVVGCCQFGHQRALSSHDGHSTGSSGRLLVHVVANLHHFSGGLEFSLSRSSMSWRQSTYRPMASQTSAQSNSCTDSKANPACMIDSGSSALDLIVGCTHCKDIPGWVVSVPKHSKVYAAATNPSMFSVEIPLPNKLEISETAQMIMGLWITLCVLAVAPEGGVNLPSGILQLQGSPLIGETP